MADKKVFIILFLIYLNSHTVQSASLIERSYEYVVNFSRSVAPSILSILDCFGENGEGWACAREKAGKLLDSWDKEVEKQRMMWAEAADAEVASSGRSLEEPPSKLGKGIELSLAAVTDLLENGMARALARKKHDSGGIDSITISTGGGEKKKKIKKKKQKPANIHLIHPVMMPLNKMEDKGPRRVQSWIVGDLEGMKSHAGDQQGLNSGIEVVDRNGKGVEDLVGYSSDEKKYTNHKVDSYVVIDVPESQRSHERYTRDAHYENRKGDEYKTKGDEIDKEGLNNQIGELNISDISDSNTGVQNGVFGDGGRKGRGIFTEMWDIGEKALDAVAEHALESENAENGLVDRSSIEEQRGKKKKKKKAILKLLILGAVLKAKIGTLLQILSFKLQVKFFIIALLGLAINLARFWVELKNKHHQQPQKVIYYEHAQHQHHYEHEEEPGWGPWSRSIEPEEVEAELEENINSPYRAHQKNAQVYPKRPLLTLS